MPRSIVEFSVDGDVEFVGRWRKDQGDMPGLVVRMNPTGEPGASDPDADVENVSPDPDGSDLADSRSVIAHLENANRTLTNSLDKEREEVARLRTAVQAVSAACDKARVDLASAQEAIARAKRWALIERLIDIEAGKQKRLDEFAAVPGQTNGVLFELTSAEWDGVRDASAWIEGCADVNGRGGEIGAKCAQRGYMTMDLDSARLVRRCLDAMISAHETPGRSTGFPDRRVLLLTKEGARLERLGLSESDWHLAHRVIGFLECALRGEDVNDPDGDAMIEVGLPGADLARRCIEWALEADERVQSDE